MTGNGTSGNPAYGNNVIEIDLLDLSKEILVHWKMILMAGIITALISGGAGAYKTYHQIDSIREEAETEYEKAYEQYEAALQIRNGKIEAYEALFQNIELLTELRNRRQDYLEKSVYLNLDPYNVAENTVLWKVTPENDVRDYYRESNLDPADEIVSSYALAAQNAIDWEEIGKEMNMDPGTIPALVSLYGDTNANELVLKVIYEDEEGAQRISESVREEIEDTLKRTARELPGHSMEMAPPVSRMTARTGIEDDRKLSTDAINAYNEKIKILRDRLETIKNPYETEELEEPEMTFSEEDLKRTFIKDIAKYAFIGFIIGCFIVCAVFGCIYLFSGALHTASELSDYYGLEILADLSGVRLSEKELLMRCAYLAEGKASGNRIIVTGTADDEYKIKVREALRTVLRGKETAECMNILSDSSALSGINEGTDVIIVEKRHLSKRKEVSEELRYISDRKGTILGAVLF